MSRMPPAAPMPPVAPLSPPSGPSDITLRHAMKLSMNQGKPILLNYYTETRLGRAFLGEDTETKERYLVKNPEEFTSQIQKLYKAEDDYIIVTENSIYIVSGLLQKKRIASHCPIDPTIRKNYFPPSRSRSRSRQDSSP